MITEHSRRGLLGGVASATLGSLWPHSLLAETAFKYVLSSSYVWAHAAARDPPTLGNRSRDSHSSTAPTTTILPYHQGDISIAS